MRVSMEPYLNKEVRIDGTFGTITGQRTEYGRVLKVCVQGARIDNQVVARHVWVHLDPSIQALNMNPKRKDPISFVGLIRKYTRKDQTEDIGVEFAHVLA